MRAAKDSLANLQSLFEKRFGFGIVAHHPIELRQTVQAFCRIGMLAAKDFEANLQSLFVQGFGFGIFSHRPIKLRQVVQVCRRIGMLPAKDLLMNLQSLFEQRFGFGIVAHILIKPRQIVQACRRIWILIAFRTLCKNNQFLSQRDRLFIFPLLRKLFDPPDQLSRRIIPSWSLRLSYEAEAKRQEHDDYVSFHFHWDHIVGTSTSLKQFFFNSFILKATPDFFTCSRVLYEADVHIETVRAFVEGSPLSGLSKRLLCC